MIFEEYTEFTNNLSIEQVKEMMKADIERKVGAYNSCYQIVIGGLSSKKTDLRKKKARKHSL